MGFFQSIQSIGSSVKQAVASPPSPLLADAQAFQQQKDVLSEYKAQALANAKTMAEAQGCRPNMTHYYTAALQLGQDNAAQMQAQGIQWTPKVFANLSGQTIDGFTINKADMEPTRALQTFAYSRACDVAQAQGRDVTLVDTLQAMQQIKQSGEPVPQGVESMKEEMDLEGLHLVNDFFGTIEHHTNFEKAKLCNIDSHPAGTLFRAGENGVAISEGCSITNAVFDGMQPNDTLTLANGEYNNIQFKNIKGGHINVAPGTHVDGMDIRGVHAEFSLGADAAIQNIKVNEDTRIISLNMAKGALIANSDFGQATMAMTSTFEPPATMQNCRFDGNCEGQDFSGLTLKNVVIGGKAITQPAQLAEFGIAYDATTKAAASQELMMQCELQQVREKAQNAMRIPSLSEQQVASVEAPQTAKAAAPQAPAAPEPMTPEEIRAALQQSLQTIGQPLTEAENNAVLANQQAIQARQEQARSAAIRALPPLSGRNV